jgi:hypothetical protein
VRLLEHLGVLLPDPRQIVDVEEPPPPAGDLVDVEEPAAQLGVGPEAVVVVGGHVVGDDVEHDPESRRLRLGHERAERRLAAEILRQPRGVDDVIAVGRPVAGLQRRGEVQMGDPQVAQVWDEPLRRREPEVGGELEAVGRPQRPRAPGAHCTTALVVCPLRRITAPA